MAEDAKTAAAAKASAAREDGTAAADSAASGEAMFEQIGPDADMQEAGGDRPGRGIDAMLGVKMDVEIVLGHARMPIAELLKLGRGSVVDLDRRIGEPVDVVVNDMLVARGNLVKTDGERIGVTLTEIVRNPAGG